MFYHLRTNSHDFIPIFIFFFFLEEGPKSPQQFKDYLLLQKSKRQDNEIAELDLKNQELHFKLCGRETELRGLEDGLEKAKVKQK